MLNREKAGGTKKFLKLMGNVVSALSILFVFYALVQTGFDVSAVSDWRIFLAICLAGVLLKSFTVFISGNAWRQWLELFSGRHCDRREALNVYAKANIGKYLPGNVMHYVERNLFAGKLGLSQKQIAAASLFEVLGLVLAAFAIGLLFTFSQMRTVLQAIFAGGVIPHIGNQAVSGRLILAAAVCAGLPAVCLLLYFCKKSARRLAQIAGGGRKLAETFISCFCSYVAVLLILGLLLVLVYWYLVQRPNPQQAVLMTAAYVTAWVLGFVIPGAPGGIGVRELVLTLLLSPMIGKDIIVALGVLHRLITVLGDFAAYFMRKWLTGPRER